MKLSFLSLWVLSISNFLHCDDIAKLKELDLYLLIGQSNMAGRASYTEEDALPIANAYLLNDSEEWEVAKVPFNRYSSIRKNLNMQKLNPGYGFIKTMTETFPEKKFGLVVNAKGGTKIEQWAKGTKFYREALKKIKIAQKSGILKGVLWHQGEGNSKDTDYLEKLVELVENLRKDLNDSDLIFVAGQVFRKSDTEIVNAEISQLPSLLKGTDFVSSENLTTFDGTHFDNASSKLLGQKYAEVIIKLNK